MGASRKPCLLDPARGRDIHTHRGAAITGACSQRAGEGRDWLLTSLSSFTYMQVHAYRDMNMS